MTENTNSPQLECCGADPADADAVPIEDLKKLVEQWDELIERDGTPEQHGRNQMLAKCCREVEALINEYQGETNA